MRLRRCRLAAITYCCLLVGGCAISHDPLPNVCDTCIDPECDPCQALVAEIEYPDVDRCEPMMALSSGPPRQFSDGAPTDFRDLSLEEAIHVFVEERPLAIVEAHALPHAIAEHEA